MTAAEIFVLLLGASLCLFAAWGVFAPQKLLQWVKDVMDADWGIVFAVVIRLLLGAALIVAAPASRFPTVFLVLGWIAIAAAIAAMLMGRERLRRFVDWWIERFSPAGVRFWVLLALAFGAFLIYGVL
jgi:hypothetical protein